MPSILQLVSSLLLLLAVAVAASSSPLQRHVSFFGSRGYSGDNVLVENKFHSFLSVRGGDMMDDEYDTEEYDSEDEYDEHDEYDSEEEEEVAPPVKKRATKTTSSSLSKSAAAAAVKARTNKVNTSKQTINASLSKTKVTTTTKRGGLKVFKKVPYIVRVCFNPVTLVSMTKSYFASLFNINYLEEDTTQTLRSALQEKAKKADPKGGNGRKGKRMMRPGQAKTLSDLPQLSA